MTLPVIKGTFGSTDYYVARMKAQDVVNRLVIPKDLPDWDDRSIEERFQREVNYNRVKKQIAPYLAHDDDRFFGALIVDIYNPAGFQFEPLGDVAKNLPGLYKSAADSFGFLHLTGEEVLVPLDGQHRLAALRFAVTGKDEKNKEIAGLNPNFDVAGDDVSLILIAHDDDKARKIFNKVNRYAKSTTKAENLVTADDDIVAIATRRDVVDPLINERLVNYRSNTLSKTAPYFTTLSTVYDSNLSILETTFQKKVDTTSLPDKSTQQLYREHLHDTWKGLLQNIELFRLATSDPSEAGDDKRRELREKFLLGKPIAQYALVLAYQRLRTASRADGSSVPPEDIYHRLNSLDWRLDSPLWQRVLMNGDRVATGKAAAKFAGRFIAYLAGEPLQEVELEALKENYRSSFPDAEQARVELPQRSVDP